MEDKAEKIRKLSKLILYHKDMYYKGDTVISDAEYDALEEQLRILDPLNPVLFLVGSPSKGKIEHNPPMLSCKKAKDMDEVVKWLMKIENRPITIGYKVDGLSLSLIYNNGNLIQAATRGNGEFGDEETFKIFNIKSIPKTIPTKERINIRGELYMTKSEFERINQNLEQKYTSPRNLAVGTLKQDQIDETRELRFMAFELLGINFHHRRELLDTLISWNFEIADFKIFDNPTEAELIEEFEKIDYNRENLDFEIDGVVFKYCQIDDIQEAGSTSSYPNWQIALKFKNKEETTHLKSITWQVGRTGILTPVAELEPVMIAGAMIRRATLHNLEFARLLNIGTGDEVVVERAGDIIPKITKIKTKGENSFEEIQFCPSCNQKLKKEEINLICENPSCKSIELQKLNYWIRTTDIKGLGLKSLEKLYNSTEVTKISDLYSPNLTRNKLIKLLGKNGETIWDSINSSRNIEFHIFLAGLGIEKLGIEMAKTLSNNFLTLEALQNTSIEELMKIEGISTITANYILDGINNPINLDVLNGDISIKYKHDLEDTVLSKKGEGKKIYVTGKVSSLTKQQIQQLIEKNGFIFSKNIGKNLDILVYGEIKENNTKLKKAIELNIKTQTWEEFIAELQSNKDEISKDEATDEISKKNLENAKKKGLNEFFS
ncbi:MAG: NAD-dependent DNA ligase LigA [Candidatus Heimdallarchaeota archaeon]|nr:NAD-dependent DNA ligase LigA [Candidatus Heimdallarchaeota archaeon]MDH5647659.1 NAD-dependent DNA ligase LigA [Candidatus Heimdallarchaeota archaeon]